MKKTIASLLCITMLFACNNDKKTEPMETASLDSKFEKYKNTFIEEIWRLNPSWATGSGYHKYDSVLEIPNEKSRISKLNAYSALIDNIKSYDEINAGLIVAGKITEKVRFGTGVVCSLRDNEEHNSDYLIASRFVTRYTLSKRIHFELISDFDVAHKNMPTGFGITALVRYNFGKISENRGK